MLPFLKLFKKKSKEEVSIEVAEFAHAHKDLVVIVADPADDRIFVGYNDKFASGRIKTIDGAKAHIVRDVLRASTFNREIDRFLHSLVDILQIRRLSFAVNNFLHYIDGALYNIARKHRQSRMQKAAEHVNEGDSPPPAGAVKSPLQAADLSPRDPD